MSRPRQSRYDGVYLLHFSKPYKHAQHYLGWGKPIVRRVIEHQKGRGVPLTKAAVGAGIELKVARTWPGKDRYFEHRLRHKVRNNRVLCPICNPGTKRPGAPRPQHDIDCPF